MPGSARERRFPGYRKTFHSLFRGAVEEARAICVASFSETEQKLQWSPRYLLHAWGIARTTQPPDTELNVSDNAPPSISHCDPSLRSLIIRRSRAPERIAGNTPSFASNDHPEHRHSRYHDLNEPKTELDLSCVRMQRPKLRCATRRIVGIIDAAKADRIVT